MSTSNKNIFDKFLQIMSDSNFCSLSDETLTIILEMYLSGSVSLEFKGCRKDLTLYDKSEFFRENFVYDESTVNFTISEYPSDVSEDSLEPFCEVNGVVPIYTFDVGTKTFTISSDLVKDDVVVCGYNYIGEFEEDLSDEECWILAYGMVLFWLDKQVKVEGKLKNFITPKGYTTHSAGNLLEKLESLKESSKKDLQRYKVSYSKGSINFKETFID